MAVKFNKRPDCIGMALSLSRFYPDAWWGGESAKAAANEDSDRKTVSAQGEGVVFVTPDTAYLTLGVETSNKEMSAASQPTKKMNEL